MRMLEELVEKGASGMTDLPRIRQGAAELEVFCIDNVAEYLYAQTDQEEWDVRKDFPCLAPPFPGFWMEFSRPSKIVSCLRGVLSNQQLPYRVGLWFSAYTPEQLEAGTSGAPQEVSRKLEKELKTIAARLNQLWTPEVERELRDFRQARGDAAFDAPAPPELSDPAKNVLNYLRQYAATRHLLKPGELAVQLERLRERKVRWVLECYSFTQLQRHGRIYGPLTRHNLQLDGDGNVIDKACGYEPHISQTEERDALSTLWFAGLMAISFCHCKNVAVRTETKPSALHKRQVQRGHDHPSFTFKILEITPMKNVLRQAGAEERLTGLKRALHICRGHFASYQEKGLFGKYLGRFWIAQHLRGSMKAGVVVKDYAVSPSGGPVEVIRKN